MKWVLSILYIVFSILFLAYLVLPNPDFPTPPPDALQSKEPADSESTLRRAYFTNLNREEVMNWYKGEFTRSGFKGIVLPTYRLNYPPEIAATIIRDQTRSTFLEEIVHPFRESIYVNGFEPKEPKDAINIEGHAFRQKIIVRYVPSDMLTRIAISLMSLVSVAVLVREYAKYAKRN